jgi:succinate dehydrogenase / fumarate reductase cytochrome b subunit
MSARASVSRGSWGLGSSVATKLVIGITGFALFLYLVIHIAGNLLVFLGPDVFNRYAHVLESNPLLPVVEIGLLLIFLIHVYKTARMFIDNRRARPVSYRLKKLAGPPSRKTLASTTMILSGLWLLVFIVIHARTFREGWGTEYPWPAGGRDLYRQEMAVFSNPLTVVFYLISMLVVGSHLWHGLASAGQSLGISHPRWTSRLLLAGKAVAVLIAGAFMVIAVWAYLSQAGGAGA